MNLEKIEQFIVKVGFPVAAASVLLWLLVVAVPELRLAILEVGSKVDLLNATLTRQQK